jgi:tetratricopeptide (TPR) repeat protein/anti-sigma regulatory factor (Ser/Thr protein kinase)
MRLLLLSVVLLLSVTLVAQKKGQQLLDSLIAAIPAAKEDTNKVLLYSAITRAYYYGNITQALNYAHKGLVLARELRWKRGIANCTNNIGLALSDTGNNQLALVYMQESLTVNKELGAALNIVNNLNNIGRIHQHMANYTLAIDFFLKALEQAEAENSHEKIAMIGTNLAVTFLTQQNYSKAEAYALLTQKHGEIAAAPVHVAKAYILLGNIKLDGHDTIAGRKYYQQAADLYSSNEMLVEKAFALSRLATLETDVNKRLKTMRLAQEIFEANSPNVIGSLENLGNMGNASLSLYKTDSSSAYKKKYLNDAADFFEKMLKRSLPGENKLVQTFALNGLSEVARLNGNYKQAFAYNEAYHKINDSLYSQDNKNKIASVESQKQIDLKDKEIQVSQLALTAQRKQRIGLIIGLCLLGIIGGMSFWQSRTRKKTNTTLMVLNNQLDDANKVKAKFFAILSHDLRGPVANLINFLHLQKEEPGLLSQQQVASNQQKITGAAESLLETMEAMLLWSKGQMENFKPEIKAVPVSQLFNHLQLFFAGTGNVQLQFADPGSMVVNTDENYLQTIMHNLTANAVKALKTTPGARIEWKAVQEGDSVYLSVTDNGPGINEEQSKALYDDATTVNTKNGLGLYLIRDLAKAIKCKISLQTAPGAGTTFTLAT